MPRGILLAAVVLVFAVAGAFAVWHTFLKSPTIRNVLLISIDTCRSDHLSCYGYPSKTTPNIDAVAAEGTLFRNAYSPIPMTLPAHCSMLTGTIPPYHGIHDNPEYGFGDEEVTLAEILKGRGFHTAAIVSAFVLNGRYGLNQGFDVYMDRMAPGPKGDVMDERKGPDTTRLALDFLQESGRKPFFLFLHYYDPHLPYAPPEPFASRFRDSPYAGEIACVDDCVGKVTGKLKELGIYDSTLLAITGDHGEMLGEHGEEAHSFFVYQGAIRVPLIVRIPGQNQGRETEEPVGLIDLVPTICALVGAQPPPHAQGTDLTPVITGRKRTQAGRYYYCESLTPTKYGANSLLGLVRDNWKYVQTTRPELYDLLEDPREEKNLLASKPDLAADFRNRLKSLLEKEVRAAKGGSTTELDPKAVASLAALGYVRGSVSEDFTFSESKEDPKDLIAFHEGCVRVRTLISQNRYPEAKTLCERLVAQRPQYPEPYSALSAMALDQRDFADALKFMAKAVELDPKDHTYHKDIATALIELNRPDEAFRHFQEAERLEPRSTDVLTLFGLGLYRAKRFDDAVRKFQKALVLDPRDENAHIGLAKVCLAQGNMDEAIRECSKALETNPNNPETHNNLAGLLVQKGKPAEALPHWAESLRLSPSQPEVLSAYGQTLLEQGQVELSLQCWQTLLRMQPNNPEAMSLAAIIMASPANPRCSNPQQSLALAQRACDITQYRDLTALHALAAAFTTLRRFQEALDAASKALSLAQESGNPAAIAQTQTLLESCKRAMQDSTRSSAP